MPKRSTPIPQVSPTLTPHRAIQLIRQQIEYLNAISTHPNSDEASSRWAKTTLALLAQAFGKPHPLVDGFHMPMMPFSVGMPASHFEEISRQAQAHQRIILESAIEQLEMLAPPAASMPPGNYNFHPEIERVSGTLFRDGHYKQAALEAYIRTIEEVKKRSGLSLDGDNLINHAFSCDNNRSPALKFNPLSSEAERDEQKALMFLFKGIVGYRNSKAHSTQLLDDPHRAHEHLATASLLMRMLEIATT